MIMNLVLLKTKHKDLNTYCKKNTVSISLTWDLNKAIFWNSDNNIIVKSNKKEKLVTWKLCSKVNQYSNKILCSNILLGVFF